MLDKLKELERILATIQDEVNKEAFDSAFIHVQLYHSTFTNLTEQSLLEHDVIALMRLHEDFQQLIPTLISQQKSVKDSIVELAGLKSANKISRTYQVE